MPEQPIAEVGRVLHALAERLRPTGGRGRPDLVVEVAQQAMPQGVEAGLTLLVGQQKPMTLAASSQVVAVVDDLQYELKQGPCLEAASGNELVVVDDLRREQRWGLFGPACSERTGVRSMLSVMLDMSAGSRAAMNFYASETDTFYEQPRAVAALLGPFAAMALEADVETRRSEQLTTALQSSRVIGTAIGIVMARELISEEQAFQRLVKASQHLNVKLREIAEAVRESGEVPERRPRPPA